MKFSIPIFFVLATSLLAVPAFADDAPAGMIATKNDIKP